MKNHERMKLTWLEGEPFRCLCTSETSKGISYMVDVLEHECHCEDFQIRHNGVPGASCKHLELARDDLMNKLLDVFRTAPRITGCPPESEVSRGPEVETSPFTEDYDPPT